MKKSYLTTSPHQTKKIGESLAKEILESKNAKTAFVLALKGELGSGKTTFLQGFAKGLRIKGKILSPTFVIIKGFNNFYHIDCYRVKKAKDLLDLGFKKIIADPKNIVAVEWADRIKKIIPKEAIWISFEFLDEDKRRIKM